MSWDIALFKFPRPLTHADEADHAPLLPMGAPAEVHATVLRHFPGTDWSDPAWGVWEEGRDSIEFNLGDDDPADSLMLHVRAGPDVIPRIRALCRQQGWTAIDCASNTFLADG